MTHYHPEFGVQIDHERDSGGTLPKLFAPLVLLRPEVIRVHDSARIDSFCKVEGGRGVVIGRWVHIASFCHLNIGGGELVMEEGSGASSGVKIITGSNDPAGESCSAVAPAEMQVVKHDIVFVGRNAILFTGAIVLPGVTIGEGAVVAAGAVVTRDIPPFEMWKGNPARYWKMRPGHEQDTIEPPVSVSERDGRRVSRKR